MIPTDSYKVTPVFAQCQEAPAAKVPLNLQGMTVPGSKSLTARALMLAALSDGETTLHGIGLSDDSRHFIQCLQDLGFALLPDEKNRQIMITGTGGRIPRQNASIHVGSAGTAARFLTAMLACCRGSWHLTSSDQMKRRPMEDLLRALTDAGCCFHFDEEEWHFPFTITSRGLQTQELSVDIGKSSQFVSALLMACVLSEKDVRIRTCGSHGMAYVRMTRRLMERFGCQVSELPPVTGRGQNVTESVKNAPAKGLPSPAQKGRETGRMSVCNEDSPSFLVKGGHLPRCGSYWVEPDISAACYFYAMAAISGGRAIVRGVHTDTLQGDIAFLDLLKRMGCSWKETEDGICLQGPEVRRLRGGFTADLSAFSDQALTLAAIAPFADAPLTLTGISHIRGQECDRIQAILENLSRMGIRAECSPLDDVTIYPGEPGSALIETYGDHRVAMSFALTGLRAPGIVIRDPRCCRKTFENYFEILDEIIKEHSTAKAGSHDL